MTNNKLEIAPMAVTIDRLTVGGKQMTKSVFNQIQRGDFFKDVISGNDLILKKDILLGYVILPGDCGQVKWYIWNENGKLRKGIFGVSDSQRVYNNHLTWIIEEYKIMKFFIPEYIADILPYSDFEGCTFSVKQTEFHKFIENNCSKFSERETTFAKRSDCSIVRWFRGGSGEQICKFHVFSKLPESGKTYLAEYMQKAQSILDYINDMQLYIAI